MLRPGASRKRIAGALTAAYGQGLLSEDTFLRRLDQTLDAGVIDSRRLVGDLNLRASGRGIRSRLEAALKTDYRGLRGDSDRDGPITLLALNWSGEQQELILGRHHDCDLVLCDPSVSRQHARLVFRDGSWVLQDLQSTNGTTVNGTPVGRYELRPGDLLLLGRTRLRID